MTVCQCSMYFLGWFIVACCCVVRFSDCYVGVERYSNGTDLEIHRSNKDASGDITTCGESQVLGEKYIIVDDLHCGYVCSEQRSSSYRKRAVGLSCFADERIRKNEPCYHGSIGKKYSSTEEIQILSVDELKTEKSIFYKDKRASKCKLNGGCSSIQYRNITSGWQATSLSGCFHISMDDSNVSVAVAEIKVSCSSAEMKQLEGLMFKMQMSCRIDEENKSYNTCFLFKLQGRYLEDESKSLYKSCAVVPTLATTSLSPSSTPLNDDNSFLVPYGIIIILIILLIVIILIIVYVMWKKRQKKRRDLYDVDGNSRTDVITSEKLRFQTNTTKNLKTSTTASTGVSMSTVSKSASNGHVKGTQDGGVGIENSTFQNDEETPPTKKNKSVEYAKVDKTKKNKKNKNDAQLPATPVLPADQNGVPLVHQMSDSIYEEIPNGSNLGVQKNTTVESQQQQQQQRSQLSSTADTDGSDDGTETLYWKSKALKRDASFKDVVDDDNNSSSSSGDQTKQKISKEKLNRISSAKGSLRNLLFDNNSTTGNDEVSPIYHNSSIPATPLGKYGNYETTSNNVIDSIYQDAPLSDVSDHLKKMKTLPDLSKQEYYQIPPAVESDKLSTDNDFYQTPPENDKFPPILPFKKPSDFDGNVGDENAEDSYHTPNSPLFNEDQENNNQSINLRRPVPDSINLIRLPYSLLNYPTRGLNSNNDDNRSMNGFCLLVVNYFLANRTMKLDDLRKNIPLILADAEDIWKDMGDGNTSVDEASFILKSTLNRDDICYRTDDEVLWSVDRRIGGNSAFNALQGIYTKQVTSTSRAGLIITFYPGNSCVCLIDEHGAQIFVDLHVHYKNSQQNKGDALNDHECGGVIAMATKRQCDEMLNYITTNMCLEIKSNSKSGSATSLAHRNNHHNEEKRNKNIGLAFI